MGALLESGLVGNIGLKHLKVIKEDTINKWDKLGFLEGLKGHLKENVAQLYENQASHLINEAASTTDSGSFETVVFPIVRRVFSKLLANDIVSVQAMNLPIGKLFYFVPKIQGYSGGTFDGVFGQSGQHYAPVGSPGNYPGNPDAGYDAADSTVSAYNPYYKKNLYDLFYEGNEAQLDPPGLFDYSKGRWSAITASTNVQTWVAGSLVNAGLSANTEYRKVIIKMCGFADNGAGKLIGPNGNEMDTEEFLSDLQIRTLATAGAADTGALSGLTMSGLYAGISQPLLFRVVTQIYGKGIVDYGSYASTTWPTTGSGGKYWNTCSADGCIYLEVDLQQPVCIDCANSSSIDGYSGYTTGDADLASADAFFAIFRRYEELEFEDKIGEVSFSYRNCYRF